MSTISPNPSPVTACTDYYRGTGITRTTNLNRGLAGQSSSYNYIWYLPFNLSAYANRTITNITLYAKRSNTGSNDVASTKRMAASYGTTIAGATAPKPDLGNAKPLGAGESWNAWDVTAAAATLQAGTGYIYLYNAAGEAYTEFFNNYSTVDTANRPYLSVTLQDGLMNVFSGGGWHQCEVYYYTNGGWVRCEPYYYSGGGWHLLG